MARAVRFDHYGDVDVLHVVEVPRPDPSPDQVLVKVFTAAINPGEIAIREGAMRQMFPSTFPSGQGSDFAGRVAALGGSVTRFALGDDVIGWSDRRSAQADFVLAQPEHLIPKPAAIDWPRAGSLYVVGVTAFAAVRAVSLQPGEVVAISGAAGGVGSVAVQLARAAGAHVIGITSDHNADWLRSVGAHPVAYGQEIPQRLAAATPNGIQAFIDLYGDGYVKLAIDLGIPPDRINTIIDFAAVKEYGVKGEGSGHASNTQVLSHLADLVAAGKLIIPISGIYPLDRVREAYRELAKRHTHGKIVLDMR